MTSELFETKIYRTKANYRHLVLKALNQGTIAVTHTLSAHGITFTLYLNGKPIQTGCNFISTVNRVKKELSKNTPEVIR